MPSVPTAFRTPPYSPPEQYEECFVAKHSILGNIYIYIHMSIHTYIPTNRYRCVYIYVMALQVREMTQVDNTLIGDIRPYFDPPREPELLSLACLSAQVLLEKAAPRLAGLEV